MRTYLLIATLGLIASHTASAEFLAVGTAPPDRTDTVTHISNSDVAVAPLAPPDTGSARFSDARGFGKKVPLSFAVQQIVPARVRVEYGPAVDQDVLVDWKGGRPWDDALRDALKGTGLHMTLHRGSITIDG